ncbi:restriction endonuclease [Mycobacterium sp. URHD0025]|uniref:restriction endonuclease n=1 Tax=Mycobacterium sp. URHD0025 TaxID=1298864 RepID=UPI0012DEC8BD|nr:restriction endonuclease [Mycobacterium sp. URHD0025]
MTSPMWSVQPGEILVREQIHGVYKGNAQAGITGSSTTPNVLVYSDHGKAAANGYDFDGWDVSQQVYYYTGEGKIGDQQMVRGNRAIADHQTNGTALRLFVAVGNVPGSDARIHQYVGQFSVDPDLPYFIRRAPGTDGVPRNVFVFRLLPIGVVVAEGDPHVSTIEGAGQAAEIATVAVDSVPVAVVNIENSEVEKSVSGTVVQREAQLTDRFKAYLEAHHREVMRYRINPVGSATLYSDLADISDNILYEAKGSAERMSVRLAIGQVLDYGRYVGDSSLAVLLPESPAADLVELLEQLDIGCVVESSPGIFIDMTSLNRCP